MKNSMYNILKLTVPPVDGTYGVEIEAEGKNLANPNPNTWRCENDGSLQSGHQAIEYVMPVPRDLKGVRKSLDELQKCYAAAGTQVIETDTSGVHVHINVQEYTPKELFTLITTYLVMEELLITYCGPSREGNHFCLRIKDAEFILHEFVRAAQERKFGHLKNENIRYASLNPCSLFKYGSLEFRAMRGTGNLDAIYEWVEILDRVKQAALNFKSPNEVIMSMSLNGEDNFIRAVLGDKAKLFLDVSGHKQMVREGARLVQPLAFIPNWEAFKDVKTNPFA